MLNVELGDKQGTAASLVACAATAMVREQFEYATQLLGVVDTLLESLHVKLLPYDHDQHTRNLAALHAQLDPATFEQAWNEGRAMTLDQAIALAQQIPTAKSQLPNSKLQLQPNYPTSPLANHPTSQA